MDLEMVLKRTVRLWHGKAVHSMDDDGVSKFQAWLATAKPGERYIYASDIAVMGDEWLETDAQLAVSVPVAAPIAHWELDEGAATPVAQVVAHSDQVDAGNVASASTVL